MTHTPPPDTSSSWPPPPPPSQFQSSSDDDDPDEHSHPPRLFPPAMQMQHHSPSSSLFPAAAAAANPDAIPHQSSLQSRRSSAFASSPPPPQNTPFFRQSSGFLSSSSDDDDDSALFTTAAHPKRNPKTVVGSKTSFILGDKLGEGAYATVKEGIDERSLRIVAVKILDLRRLRRVRGGMDAIEREVAVQKRLKRHPNLIELIDVVRPCAEKSKMYIILEMANGCTVQELLDSAPQKRLSESQVAYLTHQVLVGLHYMHGKHVVHRDIKPSNMMLSANGALKISDFGVAEFLDKYNEDDNVTRTSGSPAFQAPEIAKGDRDYSGTKVDVWALGVSIYLLLSGRIPFEGETLLALFDCIGAGEYKAVDDVSDECRDVIRRMLTVSWKDRVSVDELLKHPWVMRGAVELSREDRQSKNWLDVPKKEFGILNVVKRMYVTEEDLERTSDPPAQLASSTTEIKTAASENDRKDDGRPCCVA